MKQSLAKISLFILTALFFQSCNTIKKVEENQYLLTQSDIFVNDKKNETETITNLLYQKKNSKFLGIPFRLHFYNIALKGSDSILDEKLRKKLESGSFTEKLLSKKQFIKWFGVKKGFHNWIRKTGEPPSIYDVSKAEKSIKRIESYYKNNGWFDVKASYDTKILEKKKARIIYKITTGKPLIIDSISEKISSPKIDSVYKIIRNKSFIKKNQQYKTDDFQLEQNRLTNTLRNSGFYNFSQDYVFFEMDSIDTNKKVNIEVQIKDRVIRNQDSTIRKPFNIYKIKKVNIYSDYSYENLNNTIADSTTYKGFNIYSYNKLKYNPKALTNAIFIQPNQVFKDIDRTRTYRHISELRTFKYPNIEYIETDSTSLIANIFLTPRKKFSAGIDFDVTQSNIQTIGFSFSTSVLARNVFRGSETLEISAIGSIGASKDGSISRDQFFDINEFGADLKLTIPRIFFPVNTEKIIPKYMSPNTNISLGFTSQRNIGLDKQTVNGIFNFKWSPTNAVANRFELFNVQFVRNLNPENYFNVYETSFSSLQNIALNTYNTPTSYFLTDTNGNQYLDITQADSFINLVLQDQTFLTSNPTEYKSVNSISERKERLTENNLIFASSFSYVKDRRQNLFDNDFSILRLKLELAGNTLATVSKILGSEKNAESNRHELFNVAYSQYVKTEVDYIKHWALGGKRVLAMRGFFGIAIPYGNSTNIPFSKSFFAGGTNDNRAWTAYSLGPGSSESNNEFNEANLKLAFSLEHRFNLFGDINGALFIDAGNIWNALDDTEIEGAEFTGLSSLKDLAIGSGFGIRYDFGFAVLRGDIGFKTYDPSVSNQGRWFNSYNFKNAVYNIGINYPF